MQSQYADSGSTIPSINLIPPGTWQGRYYSVHGEGASVDCQGRYYSGHGEGASAPGRYYSTHGERSFMDWQGQRYRVHGEGASMDWQGRYYSVHRLAG